MPIERLGFRIDGTVAGMPIGRLSPVSAAGFVLANVAFLGNVLPQANRIPWVGLAAWWVACVLMGLFTSFLLAYLFDAPLLYNVGYAPPALNTCLAFLGLGLALLAIFSRPGPFPQRSARSKRRRFGPPATAGE